MISIALPIHGMDNAEFFLGRCLGSIAKQSFKDFVVVITDNCDDDRLEKHLNGLPFNIQYSRNSRKGMAQNTNEAIKRSQGDLIKILYMDDYLAHEDALLDIYNNFKGHWLITATDNNPHPHYTDNIEKGNNRLGSPSALTILNGVEKPLLFDEEMTWLLDCDYYKRMHALYGEPVIVEKVGVVMGIGEHQMTQILTDGEKEIEELYMRHKYEEN